MAALLPILLVLCVGAGLIALARRESSAVEKRWQTFAATCGGTYTPRAGKGTSPIIDLSCAGVPMRIWVYVGSGVVNGRRFVYNSLRGAVTPHGGTRREFHLLYMPDLQKEPIISDESAPLRAWLSGVDAEMRTRPGITISSDGTQLAVDLPRKRDSLDDFKLLVAVCTKLVATQQQLAG